MKKLKKNILAGIIKQIFEILYGFVLPALILRKYGSETNGLISSIKQFLGIITYMELGVDTVVQSSLYAPLANHDNVKVSQIMTSAQKFYSRLGKVLAIYVLALTIVYPLTIDSQFDYWYIAVLILTFSINRFGQYFIGITNFVLLRADQKSYIYDFLSVGVYIISTVVGAALIWLNASIQIVEIVTTLIFLLRPVCLALYVKRKYSINRHAAYESEPITQKWNGIAQHLCAIIIDGTDVIVLTLFSSLYNVSIYSVYNMVVTGVQSLALSATHGISAYLGKLIAGKDKELIQKTFGRFEWITHTLSTLIFGCTAVLLVPFVLVYTDGVTDVDYSVPLFAVLIALARMIRCIRLPYNCAILAAGHFKQTQSNYIIASAINILFSVVAVFKYGLVGVAVGTLAAFLYQDVWMAWYISKNIIEWPFKKFLWQCAVDLMVFLPAFFLSKKVLLFIEVTDYLSWSLNACFVAMVWLCVSIIMNWVFRRDEMLTAIPLFKKFNSKNDRLKLKN